MLTRIVTAIVALVVFITAICLPQIVLVVAIGAVSLIMAYECMSAVSADIKVKIFSYISTVLLYLGFAVNIMNGVNTFLTAAVILFVLMFMGLTVWLHGKVSYKDVLSSAFMTFYIVFSMSFITRLRIEAGIFSMLIIFICAWITDTGAYFAGSFLGKHKLIPNVSPKKTVEGSIGGVVLCVIICVLYPVLVNKFAGESIETGSIGYLKFAIIGMVGSVLSQLGDLVASAIKRDCDIKDYGWIFPGHGGFMDRFDSVIYIAPVIYLMMISI